MLAAYDSSSSESGDDNDENPCPDAPNTKPSAQHRNYQQEYPTGSGVVRLGSATVEVGGNVGLPLRTSRNSSSLMNVLSGYWASKLIQVAEESMPIKSQASASPATERRFQSLVYIQAQLAQRKSSDSWLVGAITRRSATLGSEGVAQDLRDALRRDAAVSRRWGAVYTTTELAATDRTLYLSTSQPYYLKRGDSTKAAGQPSSTAPAGSEHPDLRAKLEAPSWFDAALRGTSSAVASVTRPEDAIARKKALEEVMQDAAERTRAEQAAAGAGEHRSARRFHREGAHRRPLDELPVLRDHLRPLQHRPPGAAAGETACVTGHSSLASSETRGGRAGDGAGMPLGKESQHSYNGVSLEDSLGRLGLLGRAVGLSSSSSSSGGGAASVWSHVQFQGKPGWRVAESIAEAERRMLRYEGASRTLRAAAAGEYSIVPAGTQQAVVSGPGQYPAALVLPSSQAVQASMLARKSLSGAAGSSAPSLRSDDRTAPPASHSRLPAYQAKARAIAAAKAKALALARRKHTQ